ncbi:aromatic acid exporter family protein [Yinghuangia aomiensis]
MPIAPGTCPRPGEAAQRTGGGADAAQHRRRGAFVVAQWLSGNSAPLLAPLTALLVVQVTTYSTLTIGIRRMFSVLLGVLIAVASPSWST